MIRAATLEDVPRLVEMGRQFREETEYRDLILDNPAQMQAMAERLVGGPDSVVLVADNGTTLVGMIGLLLYPHHLSGEATVGEVMWWQHQEQRGAGVRLLREAERWAVEQGAVKMQMIAPSARIGAFNAKRGYRLMEWAYQKDLGVAHLGRRAG